ncbi:MAG TPA: endonuclease/exonuclease/phosphatase family protein [Paracoccaceae bacterium]|nr:endonuclease/exonuclease/phosphatase family protein [Paracoccaceae bacterium]
MRAYLTRMTIRILSYNTHKCIGLDRRRRPDRIVSVLAHAKADIVVLQEVDHRLGLRPAALPSAMVEEATGLTLLPFALSTVSLGWHGQTMLIRPNYTPLALKRIALPGLEPRGAILAELETPRGQLRVIGVHLALLSRYRRMQLAAIVAAMSHRAYMPTLIVGDFNEWSPRGGADALGPDFRLHAPGLSFPAARPLARLDRLALAHGLHLKGAGVVSGKVARIASDHLPLWAEVSTQPLE